MISAMKIINLLIVFLELEELHCGTKLHTEKSNHLTRRQRENYVKDGLPSLFNCAPSENQARDTPLFLNFELTLHPIWTNKKEIMEDPNLLTKYYAWSYRMVREIEKNGKKLEEPIKIDKFWFRQKAFLTFPPYSLRPELYIIYPEVTRKNSSLKPFMIRKCFLHVLDRIPIAIITGGTYKLVSSKTIIRFNGSESIDLNKSIRDGSTLKYHWSCSQNLKPSFCIKNPISTRNSFTIPSKYFTEGDKFKVVLRVTTEFNSTAETFQEIELVKDAVLLEIKCRKNCPPVSDWSNINFITFLSVECKQNCKDFTDEGYIWSISVRNFDYVKNTQFGRSGKKFIIERNVLEPRQYEVSVNLTDGKNRRGQAMLNLLYAAPPKVDKCWTEPTQGESLKTYFQLKCTQEPSFLPHFYELYVTEDAHLERLVLDGFYPEIYKMDFTLPSSQDRKFTVKVSIENGPFTLVPLYPRVRSSLAGKSTEEVVKTLNTLYYGETRNESLSAILTSEDPQQRELALQTFQALVNEVADVRSNDEDFKIFLEDLKFKTAVDLLNAPFRSVRDILKVGNVVSRLFSIDEPDESDPLMAKFSSCLCGKLIKKYLEMMQAERFPLELEDVSSRVSRTILKCLETNSKSNFNILEPLPVNITTPIPLEPVLIEDYPDYFDFADGYYKNIERLQESTYNIISGSLASAKAIAMSAVVGEKSLVQRGKISEILATKDKGRVVTKTKLISNGVTLVLSKDLEKSEHPVDVLMSTWTRDIFWWNPNKTKAATDIVHVEFWNSTSKKLILNFEEPTEIYFKLNKTNHFKLVKVEDVIAVPGGYSGMFHQELNRHIRVRRVTLPPGRALLVKFHNLITQIEFKVVITTFKFPTIEDFVEKKIIKSNGTTILVSVNPNEFDIWAYVGILPKKGVSERTLVNYSVSFMVRTCILWQPVKKQWHPSCQAGRRNNLSTMHCKCKHFSTIAGHVQNIASTAQLVVVPELVLEMNSDLVIFITVACTLGLYCFLLPLTLCRRKKKAVLYFLADNLTSHRYTYLIMVTTGKKGTTSHVTLQIKGKYATSLVHVLNYPDPKLRLLQKNCIDVFVMTNEKNLGNVTGIELWIDSIGTSPSWFCEEIEIYDLQSKRSFYFQLKRLFSIEKGNIYVSLKPTERQSTILKRITIWNGFHTWCFWAHEECFSYVKRLTVVLSTILMSYILVLGCQGVPQMEIKDVMDLPQYKFGWSVLWQGIWCSLVSFLLHVSLAWTFRLSALQFTTDFGQMDKFPYTVTRNCWKLLILVIITTTTFLIIWGFWVPYNQSLMWLTACGIAILCVIIIYENIVIFIISFFDKHQMLEHIEENFGAVVSMIEKQRFLLTQYFGRSLLRFHVEHLYKPLEPIQIKDRKMKEVIRRNLAEEVSDLIMFTIYTIILYVIILIDKDSFSVVSKNEIQSMFQGEHTRTLPFTSVKTVTQLYQYINQTLIPVVQPSHWYKNLSVAQPGMMIDFATKYIGVARFRQQRIMTNVCKTAKMMEFLHVEHCWTEFSMADAETRTFGYGWSNFTSILILDRLRSMWQYLRETKRETLGSIGEFGTYSGGGYVAYLGRNLHNSFVNFRKMVNKFWIDQKTRSFFIEILTYNTNYNMFNAVRLLFEQSATGCVSNRIEIYSIRTILVHNETEYVTTIFFILFVAWVALLLIKRSIGIIKNFRTFYKDFWFMVDLIIIVTSVVYIFMFLLRMKMIGNFMNSLEKARHNEFIGYFLLFYIEDVLTICAAFLVMISTARLWKFLRFGLFFRMMERTLFSAAFPLLSTTLAFFVVCLAFGLSGLLIFGNEFSELSSPLKILATLIILAIKPEEFKVTNYTDTPLEYGYFSIYFLLMQMLLFVYIIIIFMSYTKSKLDYSDENGSYNIKNFILDQSTLTSKLFRQKYDRARGGEEKKFVKPKSDEFRYANSVSTQLTTLNSMKCIAKSVIRSLVSSSTHNLTNYELKLMLEVCQRFVFFTYEEDQVEIFFKGHFFGKKVKLIDEKKIENIARVVELLLGQTNGSKRKGKNPIKKKFGSTQKYQILLQRWESALKSALSKIDDIELNLN